MDSYLKCKNCKELIDIVFESKCCGELYCHNCKSKLQSKNCLKCNISLEFQKNSFAQRLFKNMKVKCTYGCGISLFYDKMKEHLLTCEKKIYICSFDNIRNNKENNIPFKGYKKEMINHMIKSHPKILLFFMENYKTLGKKIDTKLNKCYFINDSIILNEDNEENTHIEFEHDMQSLNRINDLNFINNNINNFNDLQINNNGINNNINNYIRPLRINDNNLLGSFINSFAESDDNNSINNNNIHIMDFDMHRNNLNSLRLTNQNNSNNSNNTMNNYNNINNINNLSFDE